MSSLTLNDVNAEQLMSMADGLLRGRQAQLAKSLYEIALKFVLSDSRVTAGIVGMRFPHEVDQNVKLVEGFNPTEDFATMPRLTFEVYKAEDAQG